MIVTRLFGGLGNQMFQYAFGFALAQRFGQPLYYDLRFFGEAKDPAVVTPRSFAMNAFRLSAHECPAENNRFFFPDRSILSRLYHKGRRMLGLSALLYERKNGYDAKVIASAKPNSYLTGYWQSPLYFSATSAQLKKEFRFVNIPESVYPSLIAQYENTVSIHVRRGDYADNTTVNKKHGLLDLDYFSQAINILEQKVSPSLHFFIFSDDTAWCQRHFEWLANATIADTRHLPEWYDMYLMTLCHHHIIANSTYSWWGAWLAKSQRSVTVAPVFWQKNILTSELQITPLDWLLI